MYKEDLALKNLQGLIGHKNPTNQPTLYKNVFFYLDTCVGYAFFPPMNKDLHVEPFKICASRVKLTFSEQ